MVARFEAIIMTPGFRMRARDPLAPARSRRVLALLGSCRAHNVPSTTGNRGQQTPLSTSKAIHKPPAHHTFGLLNTPVDHQPVSDSQAEYAGSIPVIRSTKYLVRGGLATLGVGSCHVRATLESNLESIRPNLTTSRPQSPW